MKNIGFSRRPGLRAAARSLSALAACIGIAAAAHAQRGEVSYQGQLSQDGAPAVGTFDFEFRLYDSADGGAQIGVPFLGDNVLVEEGLFSLGLDFGDAFLGADECFLEISVRSGESDGAFTTLVGRVPFRSVPFSLNAGTLDGLAPEEFARQDHVHDRLFAPGDDATPVVLVDPDGNVNASGALVLGDDARIEAASPGSLGISWPDVAGSVVVAGDDDGVLMQGQAGGGGSLSLFSEDGGGAVGHGGELILASGNGSSVGAGGPGGTILLNAGWGLGTGPSKGGDIVLVPGAGTSGMDGSIILDGATLANQDVQFVQGLFDKDNDDGNPGQVLSSTGDKVDWITPSLPSALASPNGTIVLQVANDGGTTATGDLAVQGNASIAGTTTIGGYIVGSNGIQINNQGNNRLRIENDDTATRFDVNFSSGDVSLIGRPLSGKLLRIQTEVAAAGDKGFDMAVFAGTAAEGAGGTLYLAAGHAGGAGPSAGGDIRVTPGNGAGGGAKGDIEFQGNVSINRLNPQHPIHVGLDATNGNGAHLTAGGMWTNGSDRNSKTDFESVDAKDVLHSVLALQVASWRYLTEDPGVRHFGPMAQDFRAAFGLGESEKHIGTVDADGVALLAIKGLHEEMAAELAKLRDENAELRDRLATLEARETAR